jgi:predicted RNase H-like HicB family nuclease
MKMKLFAIIQPTNKGLAKSFTAYCPDIPGCIAHGPTEEKALLALQTTLSHQIQNLEELGLDPPMHHCKVKILEVETVDVEQSDYGFANVSRLH